MELIHWVDNYGSRWEDEVIFIDIFIISPEGMQAACNMNVLKTVMILFSVNKS